MRVLPIIGGVAVASLGLFLAAAGLDDADKWASVLGLFVAVAGVGLSGYGLVVSRQQRARQAVSGSVVGGGVTQVHGVRGDLRLGAAPAAPGPNPFPPCPPSASVTSPPPVSAQSDNSGQSVSGTWVAGPVHQVDNVGGDADINR